MPDSFIIGVSIAWSAAVYVLGIVLVLGVMYGLSYILGERHRESQTDETYESGIKPTGSARARYSAQFYLIAMLFVIFDLEVVFLFAWAIGVVELGLTGYLGMLVFALILIVGLFYEWRVGAIDQLLQNRVRPGSARKVDR
jgi:NADH-quinone oxidoreductase subunit A